ncbi:Uncharacterised protein (plasmid) [Mycoplasmopsis fermentans]|nr:Uncharacterised protein [Mycoplasmopsis fermentans]
MEKYLKIFNYVELWGDLKFKLIFQILAITGVRIGELANVNWTLLVKIISLKELKQKRKITLDFSQFQNLKQIIILQT